MNAKLFQQITHQMKGVMNRDLGVITEDGYAVASGEGCISKNDLECVLSFTEDYTDTFTYNGFTYKPVVNMGKAEYIIFVKGDGVVWGNAEDFMREGACRMDNFIHINAPSECRFHIVEQAHARACDSAVFKGGFAVFHENRLT